MTSESGKSVRRADTAIMAFLRWAPISPQRAPERKRGEGSTGGNAPDRCRSVRIGGDGSEERRPRRAAHQPLGRARRGDVLLAIVGGAAGGRVGGGRGGGPGAAREQGEGEPPHLARNGGEHGVAVRQMDTKGGIGQHGLYDAVQLDRFFLGHRHSVREGLRKNKGGTGALAKSRLDFCCCKASRMAG